MRPSNDSKTQAIEVAVAGVVQVGKKSEPAPNDCDEVMFNPKFQIKNLILFVDLLKQSSD